MFAVSQIWSGHGGVLRKSGKAPREYEQLGQML